MEEACDGMVGPTKRWRGRDPTYPPAILGAYSFDSANQRFGHRGIHYVNLHATELGRLDGRLFGMN